VIAQPEQSVESAETKLRLWAKPWFIFLAAIALRLAIVPFLVGDQLDPARDHWDFGWEAGRLARSLALGRGFGSPLFGWTGPSAWMCPGYPALLAGVFKVFGIYSKASAYAILSLNCLFAALTCFPLRSIARTVFGERTGVAATWVWALFPYSVDFAAGRVWSTALNALLLTFAIAVTIALERKVSALSWALWGLLWGLIGLTEPSLLSCLGATGLWLVFRLRRRGMPWAFFWRTGLAALVFLLVVTPWFVRNYRALGHFVLFREGFGLMFYQGNTWDTFDLYPDWANPPHNPAEMAEYTRVGEVAYMAEKKQQAIREVRTHPARFALATVRRVVFTWTGYWNLSSAYRRIEPFALPNVFMTTVLSALAVSGLAFGFARARRFAILFALLLLAFPVVYYITHPSTTYRHPLDPLLILLSVFAFTGRASSGKTQKAEISLPTQMPAATALPSRHRVFVPACKGGSVTTDLLPLLTPPATRPEETAFRS
jgi:4-amino-4-deoxy-L-arabinose transferase-like glycosyltransferase